MGGVYSKRRVFRGGAFILKSEILGGRSFEGAFIRGGAFIGGNTVWMLTLSLTSTLVKSVD